MTLDQDAQTMGYKIFPTVDKIAQKSVLHADLDMTVRQVSLLMEQNNVSSVLINSNNKKCLLSIEDLLGYLNNGGSGDANLSQLPEHPLSVVPYNQNILIAIQLLNTSGDRYLAVENADGSLLGILTYTDLLSAADPSILVEKKTIGELISRSTPISFSPDWFLEDVLSHFKKLEDSVVIVEDGLPLGIITTKDVFRILASGTTTNRVLSEYMTSPVVTAKSSWTVSEAFVQLKAHRIKRLIVVNDQNKLVGVITQSELVGFAFGSWITLSQHHSGELRELVSLLDKKATSMTSPDFIDKVTGLNNRQMLSVKITQEIDRIHRYHCPGFTLLLLSINPSAELNNSQDQPAIIKTLSAELTSIIRAIDDLCLWNDNTFAILLPQTNLDQADHLISRLQEKLFAIAQLEQHDFGILMNCHPYLAEESGEDFLQRITTSVEPPCA